MVSFCKKTLLLMDMKDRYSIKKDILGVVKIENNIRGVSLNVRLNVKEEEPFLLAIKVGEYITILKDLEKNAYIFKIDKDLDLDKEITIVIFINLKSPKYICSGYLVKDEIDKVINYIENYCLDGQKEAKEEDIVYATSEDLSLQEEYNDESIAKENYYTLEENNFKKGIIDNINKLDSETDICKYLEEVINEYKDKKEEDKSKDDLDKINISKNFDDNYYKEVESQIQGLFSIYEKEECLERIIKNSKFIKIDFDEEGKYYVVGIIYEEGEPKYICYGVPEIYENGVPKELLGYAEWLAVEGLNDYEGYWLMYQDAKDGKCIVKSE